jgi:hypothetical protein
MTKPNERKKQMFYFTSKISSTFAGEIGHEPVLGEGPQPEQRMKRILKTKRK